jgi:hypothetical protein
MGVLSSRGDEYPSVWLETPAKNEIAGMAQPAESALLQRAAHIVRSILMRQAGRCAHTNQLADCVVGAGFACPNLGERPVGYRAAVLADNKGAGS